MTPWVGGEPKHDWTELNNVSPTSITPTQFRPNRITEQAKSRKYRIGGLSTKFSRSSDLLTFQKKVTKHLKEHGMDTIAYLQSPTDPNKVVSVVEHHALFSPKDGAKLGNDQKVDPNKYDRYCHDNDRHAKEFLIDSLDEELEKQIYENCDDEDSFITVWFNLINLVKSTSVTRFDKIKDRYSPTKRVVKIKFRDFTQTTREEVLPFDGAPWQAAEPVHQLLRAAWPRGGKPVRLLGVGLRLQPRESDEAEQLSLFGELDGVS